MSLQPGFGGRNPDILTCIANLSNDEVFTPPEFANRMLDTLAEAWATDNDGANIWADKTVRFLDPCTKSGVFLREITRRLTDGLAEEIPDLQDRVNHILTKQVFGISITSITGMLARRSVYCSRHANGKHSIGKNFKSDDGNIWFERTDHTWRRERCTYCGASQGALDRGDEMETHAYAFIHTDNIKARLTEIFGKEMQFDVIIGNPPYQLASDGGTRDVPIYQHFVEQAKKVEPRFLVMVIPSRWMASGLGLSEFRQTMLADRSIRQIFDFPSAGEVFPGIELKAGVCYFLRDSEYVGDCSVNTIYSGETVGPVLRDLSEFDVLVRDSRAVSILRKVLAKGEPPINTILARDKEFGWTSNFDGFSHHESPGDVPLYYIRNGKRRVGYISRNQITKSEHLTDRWKLLVPEAYGAGDTIPHQILGKPIIVSAPSVCTQSYLFFSINSQAEAESVQSYYKTKFFRFLVSLRKITQHATHGTYGWVPMQAWEQKWSDELLYKKYKLTQNDVNYIESVIRPMDLDLFGGLVDG